MNRHEIETHFDKSALGYDKQWAKLAPLRESMHLLLSAVLAEIRDNARVLCVGAGTGAEMLDLAVRRPGWRFTAVDASPAMIDVCRRKAEESGVSSRCEFHAGYLETLPAGESYDAATALLVSQFITDRAERTAFFRGIGDRLRPGGWLVWSDLAADTGSVAYRSLLDVWWRLMRMEDAPPEGREKMKAAYDKDVAVLPPDEVAGIVASAGFGEPVPFYQAGLIHGWFARRS